MKPHLYFKLLCNVALVLKSVFESEICSMVGRLM